MAVTFASATTYTLSVSQVQHTFSHTVPVGTDRLLLVAVQCWGDDFAVSVTYGGVALNHIFRRFPNSTSAPTVECWGMVAPPEGTADVVITLQRAGTNYVCAAALSYSGVDQVGPIGAGATAYAASGTTCSCDLTTLAANSVIVGAKGGYGGDTYPHAPGAGVTERVDVQSGTSTTYDGGFCVGDMAAPVAGLYTWSVDQNASDDWAVVVVELMEAGSGIPDVRRVTQTLLEVDLEEASGFTGTAALSAQPAEIAATGSVPQDFTGTGAISAQPAAIAGTGSSSQAITGVGAVAAQPAAIAGTGSYTPLAITGTGALSAQAADIAGAGGQGITGTAGVTAQAASLAATGAETFAGTGAIAAPPVGIAGSGGQAFSGTGAVAAQPAEHAGTGGQAFAGAGTISAPPAESAGAGEHTVGPTTGSGALAAQPASIAAQGTYTPLAITGTGAAASQAPEIGGDGAQEFAGAGTLDAPQATVSASGQIVFGGTGSVIAPVPQISGDGTYTPLAITGIGALTVPAPTIAGSGIAALGITGTGAVAVQPAQIAGVGAFGWPTALTLDTRGGAFTLAARDTDLALDARSVGFALNARSLARTLHTRSRAFTLEDK